VVSFGHTDSVSLLVCRLCCFTTVLSADCLVSWGWENNVFVGQLKGAIAPAENHADLQMLRSLAAQDINMNVSGHKIVVHHFFSCNRPKESLLDILRHLVGQLLKIVASMPEPCQSLWDEVSRVWTRSSQSNTDPLSKDLVNILIAASKLPYGIFIILDGLDECPCFDDLVRNLQRLDKSTIKLLVGSRDFVDMTQHLGDCLKLEITADKEDLCRYVMHQLRNGNVDAESIDASLMNDISSAIHQQAAGRCVHLERVNVPFD